MSNLPPSNNDAMPGLESEIGQSSDSQSQPQPQPQQPPRVWNDADIKSDEQRVEYTTGPDIDNYYRSLRTKIMGVFEEHFHPLKVEKKLRPFATRMDAIVFTNTVCEGILKKKSTITFSFEDILKTVEDLSLYLRLNLLKKEDREFYLTYLRKFTEKFLNRGLNFEENTRLNDALRCGEGRARRLFEMANDNDNDSMPNISNMGDLLRLLMASTSQSE